MKKTYLSPRLTVYGTVATITKIGGSSITDVIAGLPTIF
jgi:hypothetical protein